MRQIAILILSLMLSACASKTPVQTQYLLTASASDQVQRFKPTMQVLALAPIGMDGLLQQNGIVYQTSPTQVVAAKQHVWAEALSTQLTNRLLQGLRSGQSHYWLVNDLPQLDQQAATLIVNFTQFNGNYQGQAVVAGEWSLLNSTGQLTVSEAFRYQQSLSDEGYPALVDALSAASSRLIEDLSAQLTQK